MIESGRDPSPKWSTNAGVLVSVAVFGLYVNPRKRSAERERSRSYPRLRMRSRVRAAGFETTVKAQGLPGERLGDGTAYSLSTAGRSRRMT